MTAPLRRTNGADVKLLRAGRRGRRHFGILGTLRRESLGLRPLPSAFGDFARHQLVLVERLNHVVVGTEAETPDLVLDAGKPGEDQNRCLHLGDAQRPQHLEAGHVRQVQVEQDDVVVVELVRSIVFVAGRDHSRQVRRFLGRVMKGHTTRVMVQPARYSKTRDGVRMEIAELQKLVLDIILHPITF